LDNASDWRNYPILVGLFVGEDRANVGSGGLRALRGPAHPLPEEVNGYFAEIGCIAVDLGNTIRDVVLSPDPHKAAQIRHDADAMDDLHPSAGVHG
jgi:phosphate uptake regulator